MSFSGFRIACAGLAVTVTVLTAGPAPAGGPMSFPTHGNWCGPGHPGNPVEAGFPPVDPLDAACMRHDLCVAARGYGSCGCDIGFMNALRSTPYPHPGLEEKARAIYEFIGLMPCTDPIGMAYKQSCVWGNLAADTMTGRGNPFDLPFRMGKLGSTVFDNKMWSGW